jgi:4-alpha-glucanotransferase
MGDLPFMVAGDSADVWARAGEFRLDARVGVPPDAFSADGQDWGLPVFRWDVMAQNDFEWMRARARREAELVRWCRVDHVVGLYRTFFRPGAQPAVGPGFFTPAEEPEQTRLGERNMNIFSHELRVVAEDLGIVPDFVRASLTRLSVPGYRVLRWEQDDGVFRDPARWPECSVATTGTHDTDSLADWYDALPDHERRALHAVPGCQGLGDRHDDGVRDGLLELVYRSPSELVLIPFPDVFGARDRVNVPGTVGGGNWTYRMPMTIDSLLSDRATSDRLLAMARRTGRLAD